MNHLSPTKHKRYSPNLYRWLLKNGGIERNQVFTDSVGQLSQRSSKLIGCLDEDGFFHGCNLMSVLCNGAREKSSCMMTWVDGGVINKNFKAVENFWEEYARIGRCAIDTDHTQHFINADNRWAYDVSGRQRTCQWCNEHAQVHEEWEELVKRSCWKPVALLPLSLAKEK